MAHCPICDSSLTLYEHNRTAFGVVCDRCFSLVKHCDEEALTLEEIRSSLDSFKELQSIKIPRIQFRVSPEKRIEQVVETIANIRLRPIRKKVESAFLEFQKKTSDSRNNYPPEIQDIVISKLNDTYLELFTINRETRFLFLGIRFTLTVDYFIKKGVFDQTQITLEDMVKTHYRRIVQFVERQCDATLKQYARKRKEEHYLFYRTEHRHDNSEEIVVIAAELFNTLYPPTSIEDRISSQG